MRRHCESCGKPKLLFRTELEVKKFIKSKHNSSANTHLVPYYCTTCDAWHITHKKH